MAITRSGVYLDRFVLHMDDCWDVRPPPPSSPTARIGNVVKNYIQFNPTKITNLEITPMTLVDGPNPRALWLGEIPSFMGMFSNLQTLNIDFAHKRTTRKALDVLAGEVSLPRLQSLSLKHLECEGSTLLGMLKAHQELKSVYLVEVCFDRLKDWTSFLVGARVDVLNLCTVTMEECEYHRGKWVVCSKLQWPRFVELPGRWTYRR